MITSLCVHVWGQQCGYSTTNCAELLLPVTPLAGIELPIILQ